jgi:uncharacterized protein (DUF2141 family)
VLYNAPADGSTLVGADAGIVIGFSERMDEQSVEDWILLTPPLPVLARRWEGGELRLTFRAALDSTKTYVLVVGRGAKDRRGNALDAPFQVSFSAGSRVDDGRIAGKLEGVKQKVGGLQVWAFDAADSAAADPARRAPERITIADDAGGFELRGLRPGRRYVVSALVDVDSNRRFSQADFVCAADETVGVPLSGDTRGIVIVVTHPREPGSVAGLVEDARCASWVAADTLSQALAAAIGGAAEDSARASAASDSAGADTTRRPVAVADTLGEATRRLAREARIAELRRSLAAVGKHSASDSVYCSRPCLVALRAEGDTSDAVTAEADRRGMYSVGDLAPGTYRIGAFRDLDGDGAAGSGEPASPDLRVIVRAGRQTSAAALAIS